MGWVPTAERWRCSRWRRVSARRLLEAGFLWARRGYELPSSLANNFNPAMLEVGIPAAWQILGLGLLAALAAAVLGLAAGRQALRGKTAGLAARQTG